LSKLPVTQDDDGGFRSAFPFEWWWWWNWLEYQPTRGITGCLVHSLRQFSLGYLLLLERRRKSSICRSQMLGSCSLVQQGVDIQRLVTRHGGGSSRGSSRAST